MIQSGHLIAILESLAEGIEVHRLVDRDDMTEGERKRHIGDGIRVLRRRELEDYLYDPSVLRTFLESEGCEQTAVTKVLEARDDLLKDQSGPTNMKDVSQPLLTKIRKITGLPALGNSRNEFAIQFLVPALRGTKNVLEELREDVLG